MSKYGKYNRKNHNPNQIHINHRQIHINHKFKRDINAEGQTHRSALLPNHIDMPKTPPQAAGFVFCS